jgi:hypothetical protein
VDKVRCVNCTGSEFYQLPEFRLCHITPTPSPETLKKWEEAENVAITYPIPEDWSFDNYCQEGFTHSKDIDLGILRYACEANGAIWPRIQPLRAWKHIVPQSFKPDEKGNYLFPRLPLPPDMKFSEWLARHIKNPYAGFVLTCDRFYTPNTNEYPGLPPQASANYPNKEHLIWPVLLDPYFIVQFNRVMRYYAELAGAPEWWQDIEYEELRFDPKNPPQPY